MFPAAQGTRCKAPPQPERIDVYRTNVRCGPRATPANLSPGPSNREIMPTFVQTVPYKEKLTTKVSAEFLSIALFCGIGLLVGLIAASCGEQGVWF
jgi:hypothetical protein